MRTMQWNDLDLSVGKCTFRILTGYTCMVYFITISLEKT